MLLKSLIENEHTSSFQKVIWSLAEDQASFVEKLDQANFALNISIWNYIKMEAEYANPHFLNFYEIKAEELKAWSRSLIERSLSAKQYELFIATIKKMQKSQTAKTRISKIKHPEFDHWRLIHMHPLEGKELCVVLSTDLSLLHQLEKSIDHQDELRAYQQKYLGAYLNISPREKEVLALTLDGLTNQETGSKLFIATETVKQHLKRVRRKTGLRNLVELMRFAQAFKIH